MKIRTKLQLGTITLAILAVMLVVLTLLLVSILQRATQKQQLAQKITETSFQLALLQSEYVMHPSERPKTQWINVYEVQWRQLVEGAPLFLSEQESVFFNDTQKVSLDARELFGELVQNTEQHRDKTVVEELTNQLSVKAQQRVSDILHLSELSRNDVLDAEHLFEIVVALLAFLIGMNALWSYRTGKSMAASLFALEEGAEKVAAGDLMHRIAASSKDELGRLAITFNEMSESIRVSKSVMADDLEAMTKLQELGMLSISEGTTDQILERIVEIAIAIVHTDRGNIQILDPETGNLHVVAHHGFDQWWLDFWNSVTKGHGVCGTALERGERVIVEDVRKSPIFVGTQALEMQLKEGVLAVQSTPLINRSGKPVGMFSTHFRTPHRPSAQELRLIDLLARQAADIIEHLQSTKALKEFSQDLEKKVQQRTEEMKKFQGAVEASTEPIAITLPSLQYVYVNPAWERLTGYSKQEVTDGPSSFTILNRLAAGTPLATCERLRAIPQEEEKKEEKERTFFSSDELILTRKDGSQYCAEMHMFPIRENGKITFFVNIHRDITQRKRSEEAKSEFVSLVSHQLRTPLSAIRLLFEALGKEKETSHDGARLIAEGHRYAASMAEMIRIMLATTRLEGGMVSVSPSTVDVFSLLAEMQTMFRSDSTEKHLSWSVECDEHLTCVTDASLLKEIITNLLSNAISYTPESGTIAIRACQEGNSLILQVRDNGCGIPLDDYPRVFTRFFRSDNAKRMRADGTGLGLYLVHAMVGLLRGKIVFTSEENKGTLFTLTLPLVAEKAATSSPTQHE